MSRFLDFDAYLRQNSVPFVGLEDAGGARPAAITVVFAASATQEQIDWANNAKETYDWRERRLLTRSQIVQHWQGLTSAQQNAIMRHLLAMLIRANRGEVLAALADTGVPLPIEEVDPT